jgi:VWFA-related protein
MMSSGKRQFLTLAALFCLFVSPLRGQQQTTQQPSDQTDDVIRINTELVQTDVMVFDRRGRFVDGLRPEEFELSLDGKTQTVSFFERVAAGSSKEAAQLAAAARGATSRNELDNKTASAGAQEDRGRLVFFFLDDLHLSGESLIRARKALVNYVDHEMRQNDQVAIVSTSGQIGFLQQLTDNRMVLHTAINRLNYKMNPEAYTGKTRISEYAASQIVDNGNRELYAYLLESIKVEQQSGPGIRHGDHRLASSYSAAPLLRNRLRQVNMQGRMTTADTLQSLEGLIFSSASLPGRKVVFFLSDGFLINERKSGAMESLRRITQAAARSGAVVYTMDLRSSLFSLGSSVDASTNEYIDPSARRVGVAMGEVSATQEPLRIIADETGGRAILNSNSIDDGIRQAIAETSDYYLLAWRPESESVRSGKSRLKVSIKNRPDLRVRLRNSFYEPPPTTAGKGTAKAVAREAAAKSTSAQKSSSASSQQTAEVELLAALGSLYPRRQLPVSVSTGYVNAAASGMTLKISMQIERDEFRFDPDEGEQKRELDVIGTAIDDRGIIKTFKQIVTVTPDLLAQRQNIPVIWNQQLSVPPGLYQVRVAVRERSTGRLGSALQWIEVPDLARGRFDLSSIFLGERKSEEIVAVSKLNTPQAITVDVDHRFPRSSVLRFQTYVYNAGRSAGARPDVWIQAQVLRDGRQVVSLPASKVPTEGSPDATRLPYWAEIGLEQLPAGRYFLQVTATDRATGASVSQRSNFVVE